MCFNGGISRVGYVKGSLKVEAGISAQYKPSFSTLPKGKIAGNRACRR